MPVLLSFGHYISSLVAAVATTTVVVVDIVFVVVVVVLFCVAVFVWNVVAAAAIAMLACVVATVVVVQEVTSDLSGTRCLLDEMSMVVILESPAHTLCPVTGHYGHLAAANKHGGWSSTLHRGVSNKI